MNWQNLQLRGLKRMSKKRMTAMERLKELRKERKKVVKKKEKMKEDNYIPKESALNKAFDKFWEKLEPESALALILHDEEVQKIMMRNNERILKRFSATKHDLKDKDRIEKVKKLQEEKREELLEFELSFVDSDYENLSKINKLVEKYSDEDYKFKKYKKYGYDVVNGEFVVNEKQLIKGMKKRRDEMRKGIKRFSKYIEKFAGNMDGVLNDLSEFSERALKDHEKRTERFLDSFRELDDTGIFRFK